MKQVTEIKIDAPIIPNQGIGEIQLGMNSYYLRDFYQKNFQDYNSGAYATEFDKGKWSSSIEGPFFGRLALNYDEYLTITTNLYSGAVSHLKVKKNYQGKVLGIAGIGDTLRAFYQANVELFCEFEDGSFFTVNHSKNIWIFRLWRLKYLMTNRELELVKRCPTIGSKDRT